MTPRPVREPAVDVARARSTGHDAMTARAVV